MHFDQVTVNGVNSNKIIPVVLEIIKNSRQIAGICEIIRKILFSERKIINMSFQFAHYNYNVMDLEKSIKFYEEALGLREVRRKEAEDGSFILAYLGDGKTGFELELTWLRDWEKDHYNLGDNEIHLAFTTDDMEASHRKHEEMGCICFENPAMGIYFINDPDGYWLEIVPEKLG